MTLILAATSLALIGISLIAIINVFSLPRLGRRPAPSPDQPLVSILIPARDEAEIIERTIRCLLTQTYLNYEIILLDDHSNDGTAERARAAAGQSHRLRVVQGQPLPDGWLGKNWACHQLAELAQGEWLVFTDADVCWAPHALAALVAELEQSQADLLTVWPTQQTESWSERLVVPLMALAIMGYLPFPLVHHSSWASFAAANGQCMAFRRGAYRTIDGHRSVAQEVLEDVLLARRLKTHSLRLRLADGANLITCRMYQGWPNVRDGFAKNILAGYGGRISLLGLGAVFHWLLFLLPWLWLALGWASPQLTGWPWWPLLLIGLGLTVRALTAASTGQRLADALLLPLSVILMSRIAAQAVWWQWRYGGPRWKGRTIRRPASVRGSYG